MRKKSTENQVKVQYVLPEGVLKDLKILSLSGGVTQKETLIRIITEAAEALPDIEKRREAFETLYGGAE